MYKIAKNPKLLLLLGSISIFLWWLSKHDDVLCRDGARASTPLLLDQSAQDNWGACPKLIMRYKSKLRSTYSAQLHGVKHINLLGYLETENKGDAAIWAAQQMLLQDLGITTHTICHQIRDEGCNRTAFDSTLRQYQHESAILLAGGGNFNDYWWNDLPAKLDAAEMYKETAIISFPQSVWLHNVRHITELISRLRKHPKLVLAARDESSFQWLKGLFNLLPAGTHQPTIIMAPDIAFIWGDQSPLARKSNKTSDIMFLLREGEESILRYDESVPPPGAGSIAFSGQEDRLLKYDRLDWEELKLAEDGKNRTAAQQTLAQSELGFKILASTKFIITDRLHVHIFAVLLGLPHVLLDSKLGKNHNFFDTWTHPCGVARKATSFAQALNLAQDYLLSSSTAKLVWTEKDRSDPVHLV